MTALRRLICRITYHALDTTGGVLRCVRCRETWQSEAE